MTDQDITNRANALSDEKLQLGAIRSLLEDDRFARYFSALKRRYEATVRVMDAIQADDSLAISEIKGVRNTYKHEIFIIESACDRIKIIDEELTLLNKERKIKTNGTEGRSNIVPPKGK